jgi:alpha-L-glutamate ligase-like protein
VNPRALYPLVDDKLLTKVVCQRHGIPVPTTYATIERLGDIVRSLREIANLRDFVVKPARGAEGRGILVIADRRESRWVNSSGELVSPVAIRYHLENTLSGLFSLGGRLDRAIVEQRIVRHDSFASIAVDGTPDVRVVLFRQVPGMAMVRLPTHASRGRANLHQGAIAAGIDLATGATFGGTCHNRAIDHHPDTGSAIAGFVIPEWKRILALSMRLADALGLGYVGIDFVIDAVRGPVVLEANARPGLAIQIANRRGLGHRLAFIDRVARKPLSDADRLQIVAEMIRTETGEVADST